MGIFSEGYGVIPKKLMKSELQPYAKLVVAYMLSYTGAGVIECFPSIKTICNDLRISNKTAIKAINDLCDYGYLEKSRMYPGDRLKHNNKYKLRFLDETGESVPHTPSQLPEYTSEVTDVHKNNNSINNNSINSIYEFWNSKPSLTTHKQKTQEMERAITRALAVRGEEEIKKAIDNYNTVLSKPELYFFTFSWPLSLFLSRGNGIIQFLDEAKPLTNFLKDKTSQSFAPSRKPTVNIIEQVKADLAQDRR